MSHDSPSRVASAWRFGREPKRRPSPPVACGCAAGSLGIGFHEFAAGRVDSGGSTRRVERRWHRVSRDCRRTSRLGGLDSESRATLASGFTRLSQDESTRGARLGESSDDGIGFHEIVARLSESCCVGMESRPRTEEKTRASGRLRLRRRLPRLRFSRIRRRTSRVGGLDSESRATMASGFTRLSQDESSRGARLGESNDDGIGFHETYHTNSMPAVPPCTKSTPCSSKLRPETEVSGA